MNLAPQYSGSIYSYPSPDFFNKIGQKRRFGPDPPTVRFAPDSRPRADIPEGRKRAKNGLMWCIKAALFANVAGRERSCRLSVAQR
jgi:hypothetical protein